MTEDIAWSKYFLFSKYKKNYFYNKALFLTFTLSYRINIMALGQVHTVNTFKAILYYLAIMCFTFSASIYIFLYFKSLSVN